MNDNFIEHLATLYCYLNLIFCYDYNIDKETKEKIHNETMNLVLIIKKLDIITQNKIHKKIQYNLIKYENIRNLFLLTEGNESTICELIYMETLINFK